MKIKQCKTNTHLSRKNWLLSREGPVSLPEDLSIPTAEKRQDKGCTVFLSLKQWGRGREGVGFSQSKTQRPHVDGEVWAAPGSHRVIFPHLSGELCSVCKDIFLILPKGREGPEKQAFSLGCDSQGRAAMTCCVGCTHHQRLPSQEGKWELK